MTDLESELRKLVDDRTHGASELARMALGIAADWARHCPAADPAALLHQLQILATQLAGTRPSMAPVANLVGAWRNSLADLRDAPLHKVREAAARAAHDGMDRSMAAVRDAASHAATLIPDGATIITHSLSSTVVEVFRQVRSRSVKAIVTESRPGLEGHLLAATLSEWQIPITVITDAQMGLFVSRAALALVGADSLLPDGSVVNKAGTSLLALAARERGVPFYVCAESFKRRPAGMGEPELEEMDPAALGAPMLPGVEAANIYFDRTPAHLLTAWIDESGVIPCPAGPLS